MFGRGSEITARIFNPQENKWSVFASLKVVQLRVIEELLTSLVPNDIVTALSKPIVKGVWIKSSTRSDDLKVAVNFSLNYLLTGITVYCLTVKITFTFRFATHIIKASSELILGSCHINGILLGHLNHKQIEIP